MKTIPYLRTDSAAEAHAKGQAAARGGIPRRAPAIYSAAQHRAWLWGWDREQ